LFKAKAVLELGAGPTAFAALALAATGAPACVIVSDGNPDSVPQLLKNIKNNSHLFTNVKVSPLHLLWEKAPQNSSPLYDFIILSDWYTSSVQYYFKIQPI
jgi:predicted nicotinamide N-methyase